MDLGIEQGQQAALTQAVVRVGDGRGFVVEDERKLRIVITAAHCLPYLPPCHPFSDLHERTYPSLLGPLGGKPTVYAECLFADPIADVAALGAPDDQELSEQAEAYEEVVKGATPIPVADAPKQGSKRHKLPYSGKFGGHVIEHTPGQGAALLLSLGGKWVKCSLKRRGAWLAIEQEALVESGMSGSPIISMAGRAIGLVSTGSTYNPVLVDNIPPRLKVRKR